MIVDLDKLSVHTILSMAEDLGCDVRLDHYSPQYRATKLEQLVAQYFLMYYDNSRELIGKRIKRIEECIRKQVGERVEDVKEWLENYDTVD